MQNKILDQIAKERKAAVAMIECLYRNEPMEKYEPKK